MYEKHMDAGPGVEMKTSEAKIPAVPSTPKNLTPKKAASLG